MADTMTLEQVHEEMLPHVDGTDTHTKVPVVKMQGWADAIDAAIKQREQNAKDAERYRWLRDKSRQMSHDPDMSGNHHWLFGCNISYALRGPTADAAIDAAMAKESGNG